MKSIHSWRQTSSYVFREINCGGCIIGTMDDFGNIVEIPVGNIVQFLWDF